MYYTIKGVVRDKNGAFAARQVAMYEKATRTLLDKKVSDGDNGSYIFYPLNAEPKTIIVFPNDGELSNAQVYENVIPISVDDTGANDIGTPGSAGFGVGVCPNTPIGMVGVTGYKDKTSPNYGNYRNTYDDSIMIWIPKFYYKWGNGSNGLAVGKCDVRGTLAYANEAAANADGYALHRAFIDGGQIKDGFFIDKFCNTGNVTKNCPSSTYNKPRISTMPSATAGNKLSDFGLTNNCGSMIEFAKRRGSGFHVSSIFCYRALSTISKAQATMATDATNCAWWTNAAQGNFPRGPTLNTYMDSCPWYPLLRPMWYSNNQSIQSGVYNFPEQNTHNGQLNGVHDIGFCAYELAPGLFYLSGNYRVIPESFKMADGIIDNTNPNGLTSSGNGSVSIGTTAPAPGWFTAAANNPFSSETNRSATNYLKTAVGMAIDNSFTSSTRNSYFDSGRMEFSTIENSLCYIGAPPISSASGQAGGTFALYVTNIWTTTETAQPIHCFRCAKYL